MMAAHKGLYEAVEMILEAGADVSLKNNDGQIAISLAKAAGHENIVELIAKYSRPKSLVEQTLNKVVSDIGQQDNKEVILAKFKATLPLDLLEKIEVLLLKNDNDELRI